MKRPRTLKEWLKHDSVGQDMRACTCFVCKEWRKETPSWREFIFYPKAKEKTK